MSCQWAGEGMIVQEIFLHILVMAGHSSVNNLRALGNCPGCSEVRKRTPDWQQIKHFMPACCGSLSYCANAHKGNWQFANCGLIVTCREIKVSFSCCSHLYKQGLLFPLLLQAKAGSFYMGRQWQDKRQWF